METVKNVICSFCGCTCDDLEVSTEENMIVSVKRACAIANEKLTTLQKERITDPFRRIEGKLEKVSLDESLDTAAKILAEARYPILYGWSNTSCEANKVGVELAEELGGVIDNTATVCHGPGIEAVHEMGEPTCSLGEVRHRADLIVYWGCNPSQAHIRHMPRYSTHSRGIFRAGRKDRKSVVVDVRKTATSRTADEFIQVDPGKDFELITALRLAFRDEELEAEKVAGVPREKVEELADMLVNCEFGIVFFGLGLTHSSGRNETVAAIISLVRELNSRTKFLLMPMRGHYNVTGSNKVFAWQTGYPFAIDFSHGYPRYNPGETSVVDILARGECDAALVVASDPAAHMPQQSVRTLARVPLVLVSPVLSATSLIADVQIPSAFVGVECEGTVYRMDGVPLLMRKVVEPPPSCLPDAQILSELLARVRRLKRVS